MSEVIRSVLISLIFFFYNKILHTQKAQKVQKAQKAPKAPKAQKRK